MEVKAAPIATLFAALFAANAVDTIATHFALGLGLTKPTPSCSRSWTSSASSASRS